MKRHTIHMAVILGAILIGNTECSKSKSSKTFELSSIDLLRGDVTLCGEEQFGEVNFSLSCSPETRADFHLAISLLHSFEYTEAEKAFVKVIDIDPKCAMAYWGVAMSNFHPLWAPPDRAQLEKGSQILNLAESLPKSEREEDYLKAIEAFYTDWESVDHQTRTHRFEEKMDEIYKKYKDDPEAAVFYALALNAAADPADRSYPNQLKAGAILESLFPDQPNHPGIAHYLIHTYDYPELAKRSLGTARKYATIAPSSAHAQHMPSHIFTRLGLWQESINSNINSTSAAQCYADRSDINAHWDEELHGMDYLVYAYLQMGDNASAEQQLNYLNTFKKTEPENFKVAYSVAALPARIPLETRDWKRAAALTLPPVVFQWETFPWQEAILHFAKGIGATRSGDRSVAEAELAILEKLRQKLVDEQDDYKANQVHIQIKALKAWITLASGKNVGAVLLMREAADMEDHTTKHPVTPGEVVPARELLGDMLLQLDSTAKALEAYETDLKDHPNRFNGLYGAGVAANKVGDKDKAWTYLKTLLEQVKPSGTTRPEIAEAQKLIGQSNQRL